ncbi:phosphoenolpyruvate--protein phosphotransferase [bacterium]|nr:phosphoenolpyruvate--protein phosphotransferase [bacterium]
MTSRTILRGHSASPGLAAGIAFWVVENSHATPRRRISRAEVSSEMGRLRAAARSASEELNALSGKLSSRQTAGFRDIFSAYTLILHDPAVLSRIEERIRRDRICADWAAEDIYNNVAAAFSRMKNRHLAARREDVEDVKRFLLDHLSPESRRGPGSGVAQGLPRSPFIAVAHELTPAQTAALLPSRVVGMVTRLGGRTSHVAIMAREIGIPHVFGLKAEQLGMIRNEDRLLVDGAAGKLFVNPAAGYARKFERRVTAVKRMQKEERKDDSLPVRTRDGAEISLRANIETDQDVHLSKSFGACGVGLFRTEYLYLRDTFPDEEALYRAYRGAARQAAPHPLHLRTMDLGGDKFLSAIEFPPDLNPMLGMRAIRLCLARPKLLLPQLRAACRANTLGNVRLCLPLVTAVEEVLEVRKHLDRAARNLAQRKIPHRVPPLGIMVEVPSVAIRIDRFLPHADFFSIGTNDLVQYTLAVSRTQESLAHLYQPFNPSILWLLARVAKFCSDARKPVSLCGEEAHNPLYIPFLLGIGIHDLSMAPPALPDIKKLIRGLDLPRCYAISRTMLELPTTFDVERYIRTEVYPMVKTIIPKHYSYIPLESEL